MPPADLEFWLFLPQMRMEMAQLVDRARAAEEAGFVGVAGMDHLAPPAAEGSPMFEAVVSATWIASRTECLRVGSLVLCDALRHPAVLAKEAVTLDHASGGRYEIGLGWGSVPSELVTFGVTSAGPRARLDRLAETLEILKALWSGEKVDYAGRCFELHDAQQLPRPLERIPIVVGGAGKRTMELVAAHADWWNVHVGILGELDRMRPLAGSARCSVQLQVGFAASPNDVDAVAAVTRRRFGDGPMVGTAPELVDRFGALRDRGVERVYVWFSDFAPPDTLLAFGEGVIRQLASSEP